MVITSGVTAVLDVIVIVLGLLGDAAREETLALFGDNFGDIAALGLEVVLHHLGFIFTAVVLENRIAFEFTHTVGNTDGLHLAAVHVHADLCGAHVDVTINDLAVAIHHRMVATVKDNAVLGVKLHDMVQVYPLEHKTASVACRGCRRNSSGGVTFGPDDRINGLGQVDGIARHLLSMRQEGKQSHHRQESPDDM